MITCDKIFIKSYYNCISQSIFGHPGFYDTPCIFTSKTVCYRARQVIEQIKLKNDYL